MLLSHPSRNIKIGFVGLPNAGKTTLFNAITGRNALVGEALFTTLEPNMGVCMQADQYLPDIAAIYEKEAIPAWVSVSIYHSECNEKVILHD